MKTAVFWFTFHWKLFPMAEQRTIIQYWFVEWLRLNRRQATIWSDGDLVYTSHGFDKLIEINISLYHMTHMSDMLLYGRYTLVCGLKGRCEVRCSGNPLYILLLPDMWRYRWLKCCLGNKIPHLIPRTWIFCDVSRKFSLSWWMICKMHRRKYICILTHLYV